MKIVFLGTPDFAIPSLRALKNSHHELMAVVSQPDREKDKKGNVLFTPVKKACKVLALPCYQFERVSKEGVDLLKQLSPDLMVTAAFGQLLSAEVLNIPKYGIFNVHASLLPKYRGSSPIQACLLNGDSESGITIMKTELSMDTGDILSVEKIPVLFNDTAFSLQEKLAEVGAKLLLKTLDLLERKELNPVAQNNAFATYTKKINKSDGLIEWSNFAETIRNQIFAFNPWPTAFSFYEGKNIKFYGADVILDAHGKAGEILVASPKEGLLIACGKGALRITSLQAPGKKKLETAEFLKGFPLKKGVQFQKDTTWIN